MLYEVLLERQTWHVNQFLKKFVLLLLWRVLALIWSFVGWWIGANIFKLFRNWFLRFFYNFVTNGFFLFKILKKFEILILTDFWNSNFNEVLEFKFQRTFEIQILTFNFVILWFAAKYLRWRIWTDKKF